MHYWLKSCISIFRNESAGLHAVNMETILLKAVPHLWRHDEVHIIWLCLHVSQELTTINPNQPSFSSLPTKAEVFLFLFFNNQWVCGGTQFQRFSLRSQQKKQIWTTPGINALVQCEVTGVNMGPTLSLHFNNMSLKGINSKSNLNLVRNARSIITRKTSLTCW